MYYEERWVKDIEETTQRLIQRIQANDIEGAKVEHTLLMDLFKKEIEWIVQQAIEGKIRKRK